VLVFPVEATREGLLFGRQLAPFMKHGWLLSMNPGQNKQRTEIRPLI
jgi:hypothetical protein